MIAQRFRLFNHIKDVFFQDNYIHGVQRFVIIEIVCNFRFRIVAICTSIVANTIFASNSIYMRVSLHLMTYRTFVPMRCAIILRYILV